MPIVGSLSRMFVPTMFTAAETGPERCEFTAPCPAGHPDAVWQTLRLDARASTSLLGCPTCDQAR